MLKNNYYSANVSDSEALNIEKTYRMDISGHQAKRAI
jgi:hypothetical protein